MQPQQPGTYKVPSLFRSESKPNSQEEPQYDDNYENMIFRAGYSSLHNDYIYNQQRAQVLQMQDDRSSTSSPMELGPDVFPPTPPPDAEVGAAGTVGAVGPPPLRYFQQFSASGSTPAEHNYAVHSPRDSLAAVSVIQAPQSAMQPARAQFISGSDSSVVTDSDEVNPLVMYDWFKGAVRPELAKHLEHELSEFKFRSEQRYNHYVLPRICDEVPSEMDYNANKSRHKKKQYASAAEESERERNNKASRWCRFKRKTEQQTKQIMMDFHHIENADLYTIQNWMEQEIYDLEEACLDMGTTPQSLLDLRQHCGFQLNKLYKP